MGWIVLYGGLSWALWGVEEQPLEVNSTPPPPPVVTTAFSQALPSVPWGVQSPTGETLSLDL